MSIQVEQPKPIKVENMMNLFSFKNITFLLLSFLISASAYSQKRTVQGVITSFESIPIYEMPVKLKGSQEIVYTDTLGRFSIECEPGDVLKIQGGKFTNQKVKIKENTKYVAVNLKYKAATEEEIHTAGYGSYISAKDNVNSIAGMSDKDLDFSMYNNIFDVIKGRFPGVEIVNNEFIVRGIQSINSSNAALIVIDGVISSYARLETVPVHLIKKIDIIKDGAGTAIYGSRGANGVVVIETKTGND